MQKVPSISEAEWEVMKVVWAKSPCTSSQIIDVLDENKDWNPKTIKTLINRLVNKNILGFKKDGRRYLYYSLIEQSECIRAENQSFLSRVYDGAIKSMLVNFIKENDLSNEDIDDLKNILNERK
ncbi:CopY/TcrY family copper transport repressor [Clostridium arbusti]|uniref:CopY/TcrY family copper transport repressor n=1 Tax=Clostridium arbusti TaxID=1137848 RepID=UPI00028A3C1C|nr:CopY/TcrY family copper transport repressor [Clostridium arbusti]